MRKIAFIFTVLISTTQVASAYAQGSSSSDPEFDEILSRDITELNVTSVNKRAQRLKDTAAAIYVITQEEIRRAGIYSIPEALRLVPGVQVAKLSADRWAVSARGFNNAINNKMLVLIDGRAIYTPVFSGVYWGDQGTTVNDIERIEVIRGPGASLYGANAVNGVINVITKSAEETQGNMLSATTTAKGNGVYEARHGAKIGDNDYYRAFAQHYDGMNWHRSRGGFRMDGKTQDSNSYTLQGDVYGGSQRARLTTPISTAPFSLTTSSEDDAYGGNVLGRWTKKLSSLSEISLQAYADHYARLEENFEQRVSTADIQAQHSVQLNDRNNFLWGGGARINYLNLASTYSASVNDRYDTHEIISAFAQNEYALVPDSLYFTAGSKFEYNDFTGFEVQPTVRMAWHPTDNQTVWGAVSRAVRTPSILEDDINIVALVTPGAPPTESRLYGNPNQKSEELIAYEIGHRIQPTANTSIDTALFYNDYDKLQTIGLPGATFPGPNGNNITPYAYNNLGSGNVYGLEVAGSWKVTPKWQLAGSYTYLRMDLDTSPGSVISLASQERLAPRNQFAIQSYYNITDSLHFDNMIYYVDNLSRPVGDYIRYDMRVAWMIKPGLEVSFIGRNLADPHPEFPSSGESDRSYIGQVLWKF